MSSSLLLARRSMMTMTMVARTRSSSRCAVRYPSIIQQQQQQQQQQPKWFTTSQPFSRLSLEWLWNQVKVPKGFENFFPKGGGSMRKKPPKKGDSGSKKNSSTFGNTKRVHESGGEGPDQPPGMVGVVLGNLFLGFIAYELYHFLHANDHLPSKEITWHDVYPLLEGNQLEKIVVVNKKLARVVLKEGAPGHSGVERVVLSHSNNTTTGGGATESVSPHADPWRDDVYTSDGSAGGGGGMTEASSTRSTKRTTTPSYHFYIGSVEMLEQKLHQAQLKTHPSQAVPIQYISETNVGLEMIKFIPSLLLLGGIVFMTRNAMGAATGAGGRGGGGGIFQVGKSNAKKINKEDVTVTFANVAGCQEAKKEIMEFVDFLQDSTRFTKLGAKIPKGALLSGPPGTGKTLLAKAVAGEANVPFYSISGSDFVEMFVGVGPSRVRDLFKEARENAPCIVFIDEIDAVGRQRGRGGFSGGNDERENTLNQLLVEMDGFSPTTGVVVLAGTNRVDILDQALTRPGRFDRQITVDKPDLNGRREIFMVHLQGITLEGNAEDIAGRLAGLTPGFVGADIANICNEAAIVAARRKGESVSMDDFERATDRIIGGLESNKIMSKDERSIVAHHEAGHAVAGWFLEHADPLLKVTIIPRSSGALGYAQYLPKEVFLRTQDQIMDIVCMALAGRAAEEIFFGRVTTGASDDLRRVTQLVYSTIQVYGMNSRVGQLAFPKDPNAMPGDKPYSDATAEAMDEEARAIVDAAYQRTLNLLRDKRDHVEKIASLLLEKETITHDDIVDLVGPRPFTPDAQYQDFVSNRPRQKSSELEEAMPGPDNPDFTPGLA